MTAPLTDEYLAEIEARRKAATRGTWENERFDHLVEIPERAYTVCVALSTSNARFIAHAPTDIDALLAEVRRLRGEIETLESALQDAEQRADTAYTHGYNVAKHGGYRI